jgi:hypothetical protein
MKTFAGGLGGPPSGTTSSTYAMGGVRGLELCLELCLRRLVTIAIAASNCAFRLRLDAAAYHAAPRRGLPRMRGMAKMQ